MYAASVIAKLTAFVRTLALLVALPMFGCALGCASAMPTYAGGSTTPQYRADVALGGAVRLPTGALKSIELDGLPNGYRRAGEAGGVVPAAMVRYGVARDWDLGVVWAGTTGRLDVRKERRVQEGIDQRVWLFSIAPYAGWIGNEDASGKGYRVGLDAPILYAAEIGGLYEFWIGPRFGAEYAAGDFAFGDVSAGGAAAGGAAAGGAGAARVNMSAWVLKSGATLGMALGFRRIHAIIELTAAWEQCFGTQRGESLRRGGMVLTPAFAMRVRL
ncbi:MAG: hypothetical protein R3A47_09675 [Polyangiales bacterium]